MGGFKPIGSEKLEGNAKLLRIMEIARYNENIPRSVNETKSTEFSVSLVDGKTYRIEKERLGYIIKVAINESESSYIDSMKSRKYYSSYSQALKRLNLMTKEINTLFEHEEETPLIGEQKKKFILKTKKEKTADLGGLPPIEEPSGLPPLPAAAGTEPAPPPPPVEEPLPPNPGEELPPSPDEEGAPLPETPGGEELPPSPDEEGAPLPETPGGEELPPSPDEEDDESMEMEVDVEDKPKEKKVSDLKRIQILVGKLAQKIRSYSEEKDLSSENVKYVINSILSALDVDVLDEDDIEEIISKLEGGNDEEDDETEEIEMEDEENEPEEVEPLPPSAPEEEPLPLNPEMAEGYDNVGDAFSDILSSAYGNVAMRSMQGQKTESIDDFYDKDYTDEYFKERRRGRKHYPNMDHFEHGTFGESTVDRILSGYFNFEEKKDYQKSFIYEENKKTIIRVANTVNQLDSALAYIKENPSAKLIGMSNKNNLIFKKGINEVKITVGGNII